MNPAQAELLESYARDFSEIKDLQAAHRVGYSLYEKNGQLGMVVCREDGQGYARAVHCVLADADLAFGRRLLRFLYENAVPPENACDVIQDVCKVTQTYAE